MLHDVTVGTQGGGSKVIGTLEHPDPPAGFGLSANGLGLDWIDLPAEIAVKIKPSTRLTGGHGSSHGLQALPVMLFRERIDGRPVMVRLDGRPALVEALDWLRGFVRAMDAVRQAHWNRERDEFQAAQRAQVPAGHVYLRFAESEDDGWTEVYVTPDGTRVKGVALAGGQRAETGMGAWAYATPEAVAAAVERQAERERDQAERDAARDRTNAARRAELLAEVVPDDALDAYRRYGGSAERAWEREDETAYALIGRWDLAIEAQGLAGPSLAGWREDDLAEVADRAEKPGATGQ